MFKRIGLHIYWGILSILRIPESIFVFTSGIFLSASINIAVRMVGENNLSRLSSNITFSMVLMFLASLLFMILAVMVKPIQENFKTKDVTQKKYIKETKKGNAWHAIIRESGVSQALMIIILLSALVASVFSILVLFNPSLFEWLNSATTLEQVTNLGGVYVQS